MTLISTKGGRLPSSLPQLPFAFIEKEKICDFSKWKSIPSVLVATHVDARLRIAFSKSDDSLTPY